MAKKSPRRKLIIKLDEPVVAEKAPANPHDWSEAVKAVYKLKKEKGL